MTSKKDSFSDIILSAMILKLCVYKEANFEWIFEEKYLVESWELITWYRSLNILKWCYH